MTDVLIVLVALMGLAVGSFLNVCIHRLPVGVSIVTPPSRCPACGHLLRWYENIPIVSYAALRGRCRACRASISWQYPLVELATAGVFVVSFLTYGPTMLFVSRIVLACMLIVLCVIDLEHRLLPNVITLPGIVVGFVFSLFADPGWTSSLLGIALGGGGLLLIAESYYRIRHEAGLGMGDVKMLAMIGAFLGWRLTLLTLILSSFAGAVVGVAMIAARKGDLKYALPFGTFLAAGALAAMFAGDPLIDWYLGFYTR